MRGHMSRGRISSGRRRASLGDVPIKSFHQDKRDRYGGEGGKPILSTKGSKRDSLMHEKLVGLEWTEILMTSMSKIQDRGIRVDLERKSGWASGVMSRISG